MLKKVSSLIEYIAYLYKYNVELQNANTSIFRIIKSEKDKNGKYIVDVQVINKSSIFRCDAKEIATQDQLLECFSKSDVRLITYLATKDLLKPKSHIVGFEYNPQTERTILQIKENGSTKLKKLTADKISSDLDLLKNLSQEDAHRAGFLTAVEQMIIEKKTIEKSKSKSKFLVS